MRVCVRIVLCVCVCCERASEVCECVPVLMNL